MKNKDESMKGSKNESSELINKPVSEMTDAERKVHLKKVFDRVVERNGDALTKLSKN